MNDHNRSSACLQSRNINGYDGRAGSPLGIDVFTQFQKGTKTGNTCRIMDLATPAGFNQHDLEEYFLKLFLATNLAFNCSNNVAFRRVFKYIRPGVQIPSPRKLTKQLRWWTSLRWMIFEHVYVLHERFLSLPIRGRCNKHIPVGVSLNGERLIVVRIVIVDYLHSLVGGSLIDIRPEGTKSNR